MSSRSESLISPEAIQSVQVEGNMATCSCVGGTLRFTAYGPGILHVAFYPERPVALPMWGISGQPDPEAVWTVEETKAEMQFSCGPLTIRVERDSAMFTVTNRRGGSLPACRELFLEPAEVSGEQTFHAGASFDALPDEHIYGLGQHQLGWMDHAGKEVQLWHDYQAEGGEIVAVPFLVSSVGYGLVWDNPSRSRVLPCRDGRTSWWSEVGEAVSFFYLAGPDAESIYRGYRTLTGATPLPPLAALGYIQCKQRYKTREELMRIARGYRGRGYPCDILVIDWFHWKHLGDMDLDPDFWPDPAGMNRDLSELGYQTMIACWPRFKHESAHYAELEANGWFMQDGEGETVYGTPEDRRGALIDTTNPEAAAWYWQTIRDNYADRGFTSWWLDENEPDISPHAFHLHAGTGARIHNVYPLTHTGAVYEGHRRDLETRPLILSRSAYHGAQCHGTTFWSSDINPTWDAFRRQIPAGLNFCASGMPYWSSDIGGWQPRPKAELEDASYQSLLLKTQEASRTADDSPGEYPELYARWFQFGAFCPTFRAHGTRPENEVWSYGKAVEQILVRYLRLRYRLLPYIYSLAYQTSLTGAPFMRALFMDFPEDGMVADLKDQYMFGPAFLVAPVIEPGARTRRVWLPRGTDWYDFWTGERHTGGQALDTPAPLDRLPLFVRAGSILPMGEVVPHTGVVQTEIRLHVYPGADAAFDLYRDDGLSLEHERGAFSLTPLRWHDTDGRLEVEDDPEELFTGPRSEWLHVEGTGPLKGGDPQ